MSYYMTSVLRLGPAFSPARRAIVHLSHESHHALAQFRGTLHLFIVLFHLICDCACTLHLIRIIAVLISYRNHIISSRVIPPSHYLSRLRRCSHSLSPHTHTHTLSLPSLFSFVPLLSPSGLQPALDHPARTCLTVLSKDESELF